MPQLTSIHPYWLQTHRFSTLQNRGEPSSRKVETRSLSKRLLNSSEKPFPTMHLKAKISPTLSAYWQSEPADRSRNEKLNWKLNIHSLFFSKFMLGSKPTLLWKMSAGTKIVEANLHLWSLYVSTSAANNGGATRQPWPYLKANNIRLKSPSRHKRPTGASGEPARAWAPVTRRCRREARTGPGSPPPPRPGPDWARPGPRLLQAWRLP